MKIAQKRGGAGPGSSRGGASRLTPHELQESEAARLMRAEEVRAHTRD